MITKMPFGKHKGKWIRDIPANYLKRLLTQDIQKNLRVGVERLSARYIQYTKTNNNYQYYNPVTDERGTLSEPQYYRWTGQYGKLGKYDRERKSS